MVRIFAGDIGKPSTGVALVDLAEKEFGGLDVLVSNAGVFKPKPFLDLTEEEYDWFLDTILKGKFFLAQAAAKAMKKRGGGSIVHTGSLWALQAIGATPSAAYSAANAGVHALVHNLALELAADKIRINAVAPAVVETPIYSTFPFQGGGPEGSADLQCVPSAGKDWSARRCSGSDSLLRVRPERMDHWNHTAGRRRRDGRPKLGR